MSDEAHYSAGLFSRNNDEMTINLRGEGTLDDVSQLIQLYRNANPPPASSASTTLTTDTSIFSSRGYSTQPTSAGDSRPLHGYYRDDQAAAAYASSLSATHGSGSDSERDAVQYLNLFGLGGWTTDDPNAPRPLKGSAKGRRPLPRMRYHKAKKYDIVLHNDGREERDQYVTLSSDDEDPNVAQWEAPHRNWKEAKLAHQRRDEMPQNQLASFAKDDVSMESPAEPLTLPRARFHVLVGLVVTFVLTFALCTYTAYHSSKQRTACFKGILFCATVLVSWYFAIIAMIRARRVMLEAILALLLQLLLGVALVADIHDLM